MQTRIVGNLPERQAGASAAPAAASFRLVEKGTFDDDDHWARATQLSHELGKEVPEKPSLSWSNGLAEELLARGRAKLAPDGTIDVIDEPRVLDVFWLVARQADQDCERRVQSGQTVKESGQVTTWDRQGQPQRRTFVIERDARRTVVMWRYEGERKCRRFVIARRSLATHPVLTRRTTRTRGSHRVGHAGLGVRIQSGADPPPGPPEPPAPCPDAVGAGLLRAPLRAQGGAL